MGLARRSRNGQIAVKLSRNELRGASEALAFSSIIRITAQTNRLATMQHIDQQLTKIESETTIRSRADAYNSLREIGLTDFAWVLANMPNSRFPKTSTLLPHFASEEVQINWTGNFGQALLSQSLDFVRSVAANYMQLTNSNLAGKKILDFGSGYGRHLRMFAFYSDNVFGVDPWDESIRHCKESGIENVSLSDYLPAELPAPFDNDLAYAFSVFTHLSENATLTCLKALRRHVKRDGILCITIRPIEYWRLAHPDWPEEKLALFEEQHQRGFAFDPHLGAKTNGQITYGDTSMTIDWLRTACLQMKWEIVAVDRSVDDTIQRHIFLRAN